MKKIFDKTNIKVNAIYEYILDFNDINGYCPSLRQIGNKLAISSPSLVKYYVDVLEKEGKIFRGEFPRRIITLPKKREDNASKIESYGTASLTNSEIKHENVFYCPILGNVAAGSPIFVSENIADYFPLPKNSFNKNDTFMLEVVGDSMVNAGIANNDIVIVDRGKQIDDGKIVVALIDDSATVKRFFKKGDIVVLHPENEHYNDIILDDSLSFSILGTVVGLIRKF